jgi:uncharacterized membrane protein YhiD involved in acid resistance
LNAAATVCCAAAIGTLAGYGMYGSAATGAMAVISANVCLRPIGKALKAHLTNGRYIKSFELAVLAERRRLVKSLAKMGQSTPRVHDVNYGSCDKLLKANTGEVAERLKAAVC